MRRVPELALAVLASVLLAACGSGAAGAPAGDDAAALVPASADLVVTLDGELEDGWEDAEELLEEFPRLDVFVQEALGGLGGSREEWDAALGPDVTFVVVNLDYREAVALTEPDDPAELRRLVEEAGGTVADVGDGWWAAAHDARAIERLGSALEADGALSERDDFRRLTDDLPDDAFARVFVRGGPADDALADLPALPEPLGRALDCLASGREIPSAALALRAEDDGLRLDGALERPEAWPDGGDGFSTIADTISERPLLFAGAASLPEGVDRALACAAGADGESLELLRTLGLAATSLLSGEVAVGVYPDAPNPLAVALFAEVEDEEQALATVEELAGLASALAPGLEVADVDVDPDQTAPAKVVTLDGEPILYLGVDQGLVAVSSTERGVEGLLAVDDDPLSEDDRYRDAAEQAFGEYPSETDALLYLDAEAALEQGEAHDWAADLEALDTLFVTAETADERVKVQGFLAID